MFLHNVTPSLDLLIGNKIGQVNIVTGSCIAGHSGRWEHMECMS